MVTCPRTVSSSTDDDDSGKCSHQTLRGLCVRLCVHLVWSEAAEN